MIGWVSPDTKYIYVCLFEYFISITNCNGSFTLITQSVYDYVVVRCLITHVLLCVLCVQVDHYVNYIDHSE